jgi:hypothetical protein
MSLITILPARSVAVYIVRAANVMFVLSAADCAVIMSSNKVLVKYRFRPAKFLMWTVSHDVTNCSLTSVHFDLKEVRLSVLMQTCTIKKALLSCARGELVQVIFQRNIHFEYVWSCVDTLIENFYQPPLSWKRINIYWGSKVGVYRFYTNLRPVSKFWAPGGRNKEISVLRIQKF